MGHLNRVRARFLNTLAGSILGVKRGPREVVLAEQQSGVREAPQAQQLCPASRLAKINARRRHR
jgi:hypothetical protein